MQLHQLKPNSSKKARKRVGRGGKRGTYAGRGLKGQKSRAGKMPRLGFAGGDTPAAMRFPKKRGSVGSTEVRKGVKNFRYKIKPVVLNLDKIDKCFQAGEVVSLDSLLEKGLIRRTKNRIPVVKILGQGKLTKELVFEGVKFSASVGKVIKTKKKKEK